VNAIQSNPSWQQRLDAGPRSSDPDLSRRLQAAENEIRTLKQQLEVNTSFDYTNRTTDQNQPTTPLEEQGITSPGLSGILNRLGVLEGAAAKSSQPTYPSVRITGFSQLDHVSFAQSASSRDTVGDIQDGTGFRRTRLAAAGNLTDQTKYWLEMDFAAVGRPSFMDVWGEQSDIPFIGNLRIGQFRQPITLDGAVNVRHLEFMEYSSAFFAFDPFRRVGIGAWYLSDDERTFVNYSVYGTGSSFFNGTNPSNGITVMNTLGGDNRFGTIISDNGVSAAIRATHLLYWDEMSGGRYFFHVGGGYNFSEPAGVRGVATGAFGQTYQARSGPEIFVGDPASGGTNLGGTPNVLDTGRFLANNFSIYHAEMCGNYGPAHFQTEYIATVVSQLNGPQVLLDGAYFQTGYFLTGENCGYNKNMGAIDYNVTPFSNFFALGRDKSFCGWGAWEVAGRVSWLDLSGGGNIRTQNQTNLPGGLVTTPVNPPTVAPVSNPFINKPALGGINQGQLVHLTFALNWWWNPYTRLQFNYIYSMANTNNGGGGPTAPGVAGPAPFVNYGFNSLSAIGGRFQFEF
jgi:phosphate-selective porin OprO/OprP